MHHVQGSVLTLGGDPFETAAEALGYRRPEASCQWIVNVAFTTLVSVRSLRPWLRLAHAPGSHPLINCSVTCGSQQREGSAEGMKSGVTSASKRVNRRYTQVAAEFPFQIAEAPALRCFMTQRAARDREGCRVARCALRRGNVPPDIAGPNQPKRDPPRVDRQIEQNSSFSSTACWPKGNRRARIGAR